MSKLLTLVEVACLLGIGMELAESLTKKCPRPDSDRILEPTEESNEVGPLFNRGDVLSYSTFLNSPWPKTKAGNRPNIPAVIKRDVSAESHEMCAVCTYMNGCEYAHIVPVSESENNNTDNLIYLCPNHHTQYDYGYKVANNVTIEVVRAAKEVKQNSRRRMLKYEHNTTALLKNVVGLAKQIQKKLKEEENADLREVQLGELKSLLTQLPDLVKQAEDQAAKDKGANELNDAILEQAGRILKSTIGVNAESNEKQLLQSASELEGIAGDIELDLDEVDCPHCFGNGTTGLVSNYCSLCDGRTYVTEGVSDNYVREDYSEVECPRCHGRGTFGLVNDFCGFCHGDCLVDREAAAAFDENELDEVECPRCHGNGITGVRQRFCSVCGGSCVVSKEAAKDYSEYSVDEVECPHCKGSGRKGGSYDFCEYCNGDCVVTHEMNDKYDPSDIDEVECPHCGGSGRRGFSPDNCVFCSGAGIVTRQESESHDSKEFDESECPHCDGSGKLNFFEYCSECRGAAVLTADELAEYTERINELADCPHCEGSGTRGRDNKSCNLCKGQKYVTPEIERKYREKYG